MSTHYSTIELKKHVPEEHEIQQSSDSLYRVIAVSFSLFALFGLLAVLGQDKIVPVQLEAVEDAEGLNCIDAVEQPKWAGELEEEQTEFWSRACYHSFRCCTTVDPGCLASQGYGPKCQACLGRASPQLLRQPCLQFVGTQGYTKEQAMAGKTPYLPTGTPPDGRTPWGEWIGSEGIQGSDWIGAFMNEDGELKGCYNKPAGGSPEANRYADACWIGVDWCNLQCPRDAPTFQHEMCKHCISRGFFTAKEGTKRVNGDTYVNKIPLKIGI